MTIPSLGDRWLFEELPAHGRQQLVHGQVRQVRVGEQQITGDSEAGGKQEDPEHQGGQPGGEQFGFRFFRHQIVGSTHEGHQHPDDQGIGMRPCGPR